MYHYSFEEFSHKSLGYFQFCLASNINTFYPSGIQDYLQLGNHNILEKSASSIFYTSREPTKIILLRRESVFFYIKIKLISLNDRNLIFLKKSQVVMLH
ncbi:hypothetical protein BpHYR1_020561 [Brachionus plicatilis]|uniref:Uncharacterized protein n=1 Tax=Brachionus plicatilis TaxID=10195 RepID=A0A3M7S7Y1_BRAPC|nr:hypothetical protein BpHYR1_020561 [Brachionus plicatilis]